MKNLFPHPEKELDSFSNGELDELKFELSKQKDRYLRLAADFENFKKQTIRDYKQKASAEKEAFIHDLLPVLDNLGRALSSSKQATTAQLQQGVAMTLQQLYQLLHNEGIEPVEDLGVLLIPIVIMLNRWDATLINMTRLFWRSFKEDTPVMGKYFVPHQLS